MTEAIISLDHVSRIYSMGQPRGPRPGRRQPGGAPGEFVAIVGPSGSGKTTMMNILGCLDRPTSGGYSLAGTPVADLDDDGLAQVRSRSIGFVFQSYNLLPRTSALDNVATPLLYQGVSRRERAARAKAALERLGMGDRLDHEPTELSGGQQQRVAVARALVTEPALILADEPTGNLDSHAGAEVMALLHELNAAGRTIVLITHDTEVAATANRQIHLRDGRVVVMSIRELLRLSLSRLRTSRLRAALTMLGVIIGVASVVALVGVGQGTTSNITSRLAGLGTNLLTISPTGGGDSTLTVGDADAIAALPGIGGRRPGDLDQPDRRGRHGDCDDHGRRHDPGLPDRSGPTTSGRARS